MIAAEEIVLATEGDWPDCILCKIIVDVYPAVVKVLIISPLGYRSYHYFGTDI